MASHVSSPAEAGAAIGSEEIHDEQHAHRRLQTLNKLSGLPVFNKTALNLVTIPSDSDSAREQFETAFHGDPTLAADLLILANSPQFGFRTHVTSIPHAISLLGLERVRELACSIALRLFARNAAGADCTTWWKHSMASAALAAHMSRTLSIPYALLPTASLLHDIGNLGLQMTMRKDSPANSPLWPSDMQTALKAERNVFGISHDEAGAMMARTWGFPDELQRYIDKHHTVLDPNQDPVASLVQVTCRLAEGLGYPEFSSIHVDGPARVEELLPEPCREHPALEPELLAKVIKTHLESAGKLGQD